MLRGCDQGVYKRLLQNVVGRDDGYSLTPSLTH